MSFVLISESDYIFTTLANDHKVFGVLFKRCSLNGRVKHIPCILLEILVYKFYYFLFLSDQEESISEKLN